MAEPIQLRLEQIEILDAAAVGKSLQKRMAEPKGRLKKLSDEATNRGYKKVAGPQGEVGIRQKFKASRPVRPPGGQKGSPVDSLEFEMALSALEDPNSDDQAAIATVTITAGQNTAE
jgi:hypothetical protein